MSLLRQFQEKYTINEDKKKLKTQIFEEKVNYLEKLL